MNMSLNAKRDLNVGDLVIDHNPISYVLTNLHVTHFCSTCNKP